MVVVALVSAAITGYGHVLLDRAQERLEEATGPIVKALEATENVKGEEPGLIREALLLRPRGRDPEMKADLRQVSDHRASALGLLERAVEQPRSRYEFRYRDGNEAEITMFLPVPHLSRLLFVKGALALEEGNRTELCWRLDPFLARAGP